MKTLETRDGVILDIYVKPRSASFKALVESDTVVVYCIEEPHGGRVNRELIKELSKLFHKKVELVSGFGSRDKRVLVRNALKSEVEQILYSR